MGATCCQGRGGKPASPSPLTGPSKSIKRKRRASLRMQSLRTRGISMSEPPKQADEPQPGAFTQAFLRLIKPQDRNPSSHRGSDPTSADKTCLDDGKEEMKVGELPAGQQLEIQKLLFNSGEVAQAVYPMEFHREGESSIGGRALLSTSQVYLFSGEDNFTAADFTLSLDSLSVLCLHHASSIFLLTDCPPDCAYLYLRSGHMTVFIKAVQQLAHQRLNAYIPMVVFDDHAKMVAYAGRLSASEIHELHSQESLKILELIMTTSGDPYESKLLQQPCAYHGKGLSFLLTSKRLYLVSEDYRAVETKRLSDVTRVEFSQGTVSIGGKEWRMEVEMQDCAKVIELARKSA